MADAPSSSPPTSPAQSPGALEPDVSTPRAAATTQRREQQRRREEAEKQQQQQQQQQGSWGWSSMWSAVSGIGAVVADKVIDAFEGAESALGLDDPPTPSLSSVLREAQQKRDAEAEETGPQDTREKSPPKAVPPSPTLSQLLREAAERKEREQAEPRAPEPSLLDVVGDALESAISAPALQGLSSALADTKARAREKLSIAAAAVFGPDEEEAPQLASIKRTDVNGFIEEYNGNAHVEALQLLAETLTEENRARPLTVSKEKFAAFEADLQTMLACFEAPALAETPAANAMDSLVAFLEGVLPGVGSGEKLRIVHFEAVTWVEQHRVVAEVAAEKRQETLDEIYMKGVQTFAKATSALLEQLHKIGETLALRASKESIRLTTLRQASDLGLVSHFFAMHLDTIAALFGDLLLEAGVRFGSVEERDQQRTAQLQLEAAAAMEHVRHALDHLSPVLQALLWDAIDAGEDFLQAGNLPPASARLAGEHAGAEAKAPTFPKPVRRPSTSSSATAGATTAAPAAGMVAAAAATVVVAESGGGVEERGAEEAAAEENNGEQEDKKEEGEGEEGNKAAAEESSDAFVEAAEN